MTAMNLIRERLGFLPAHLHRLLPAWLVMGGLAWLAPSALVEWLGVAAQPWFWWLLLPAVLLLAARLAPARHRPPSLRTRNASAPRRRRPRPADTLARAA